MYVVGCMDDITYDLSTEFLTYNNKIPEIDRKLKIAINSI